MKDLVQPQHKYGQSYIEENVAACRKRGDSWARPAAAAAAVCC